MKMTDDRKEVLGRIKKALRVKAPKHSKHAAETEVANTPPVSQDGPTFTNQLPIINNAHASAQFRNWMPQVGPTWEDQVKRFAANSADLKTEFHLCENEAEFLAHLTALSRELGWTKVGTHKGVLTDKAVAALGLPTTQTENGYAVEDLEACNVGITECEALVAQTGSVLVTPGSAGGRALSVLPPHHVVIARRDQMLPDLTAAFQYLENKYGTAYPSMMSFITGPSRTGDIERILVLGAHGPKRLTIYCV